MIPRFSNPALLQNATKIVSRADLYGSDLKNASEDHIIDEEPRLKRLQELVEHSLGDFTSGLPAESHRRKRRKVEEISKDDKHECIAIRMFFSGLIPCR